jgi:outer membrane lipoprotein LolB
VKRRELAAAFAGALLLAGCATPTRPSEPAAAFWSGRLALQVEDRPSQSFSALFELRGNAGAGELTLTSPIGSVLAVLSWQPGRALLESGGSRREFASVEELATQATDTALPVQALFDWLNGKATPVQGWQADLGGLAEGRLRARRTDPAPAADLRIALER